MPSLPALSGSELPTSPPPPPRHLPLAAVLHGGASRAHLLQLLARVLRLGLHADALLAARLLGRLPHPLSLRLLRLLPPAFLPLNAALRSLADASLPAPAFAVFRSLGRNLLRPNGLTFSFLLKAALASKDPFLIRQVHTVVAKSPFGSDSSVLNGLVLAYGKGAGDVGSARKVFDGMPEKRTACSWSCLITEYARCGMVEDALGMFLRMVREKVRLEDDTMVGVISACAKIADAEIEKWVEIFSEFEYGVDRSLCSTVDTVLVYLYAKCGRTEEGRALFDEMMMNAKGSLSVVSWNCMIGAYVQNNQPVEALSLFRCMLDLGDPRPNHVTVVNLLSACSSVGNLELGRWAYEYVKTERRRGVIESNRILATAFIDMFCKCGSLEEARTVFEGIANKDVISFNAMIMGFATNGREDDALRLFFDMEKSRVKPNGGTFLGLLCACTHSGLVGEGRRFFDDMKRKYSVTPNIEHYACYIDLLARAGRIGEALDVVRAMPIRPNAMVWGALLGACLVHSEVDVAQNVAEKLVSVDPGNSAGYVLLSNAYAFDHSWPGIEETRGLMKMRCVRKQPGLSWININGVAHEFRVGASLSPRFDELSFVLNSLSREMRSLSN